MQFFKVCLKLGKGALKEYEFQVFWTVNIVSIANHYTISKRQLERVNLSVSQLWFNPSWELSTRQLLTHSLSLLKVGWEGELEKSKIYEIRTNY